MLDPIQDAKKSIAVSTVLKTQINTISSKFF